MLSSIRAFIIFAVVIGIEMFAIGAVTAAQIPGTDMAELGDAIITILTGLGAFVGIFLASMGVFLRQMFKRWNPEDFDPMEMLFYKKLRKSSDLQPVVEHLERLDKAVALLAERAVQRDEDSENMGSGEQYLRSKTDG